MGQDGYIDVARRLMQVASRMKEGIQEIEVRYANRKFQCVYTLHCFISVSVRIV